MTDTPGFLSPERENAFYVPSRYDELVQFTCAGIIAVFLLQGIFTMLPTGQNVLMLAALAGTGLWTFWNGLGAWRYRLKRIAEVARMRAEALRPLP